jgi:raffinose/stachyose/melibiose transport system permease protein
VESRSSTDVLTVGHYIGLANYREVFSDPLVRDSFKHSAELIVFYALLPVALGLLLTAILTRHPVRGFTFTAPPSSCRR